MSDAPIVSIDHIKRRAQRDFAAGLPCPYNWSRDGAYVTWHAETSRLQVSAQAFPQSHIAPATVLRVDEEQVTA